METLIPLADADWLGLMAPARGESCPAGQRRGPAAPGKDKFPAPDQKSFNTSTTPTTRGRNRRSSGSISPDIIWKPQPHRRVADWLVLMEPAHGESSPSGHAEVPPHSGRIGVLFPDHKSFHISTTPTTLGQKGRSLGSIRPRTADCWLPGVHGASARRELPRGPTSRSRHTQGG